ncbi:hypothetical protein ZOSMA_297G00020 [Zostera marina]|uniref:Uncharacterized protein n=1 Tax=Zostera marina TaxID=29655 RepID=A0A0K9PE57_ZOSMR|nr:hypothetical protein ZOSMA_297G00020 [Zostera marina]
MIIVTSFRNLSSLRQVSFHVDDMEIMFGVLLFNSNIMGLNRWMSCAQFRSKTITLRLYPQLFGVRQLLLTARQGDDLERRVTGVDISKLSITHVVCVLESILHSKRYFSRVIMAVINGKGFLCAFVAVLCTSLQQILIGSFQKKYSIESLGKTAPVQAFFLLVFGLYVDYYLNGSNILTYQFSYSAVFFIVFSCSLPRILRLSLNFQLVVSTKSPRSDKQYVWKVVVDSSSYVIEGVTVPEKLLLCGTQITLYLRVR